MIIGILCLIIAIIIFILGCYQIQHAHKINTDIAEKNKILQEENNKIQQEYDKQRLALQNINNELNNVNIVLEQKKTNIDSLNSIIADTSEKQKTMLDNQKQLSETAFESYCEVLDKEYEDKDAEYAELTQALVDAYEVQQLKLLAEVEEVRKDLDKLRATRQNAISAARREKEIEDNVSFYCLQIDDADKADITRLEAIKPSLNKPRVLSMLIWQTFFQKNLKSLTAQVLDADDKMGIYKITNIKTKECYVGQAVSIRERWADHAKASLGIDTPAGNKLYKAMQEYGLWNFSWELLEECPREQLNEKEKFYIELYDAVNSGYNSSKGVSK